MFHLFLIAIFREHCCANHIKVKIPAQGWRGPEGSRRFQVERLSALCTCHIYSPGNIPGTHFC